MSTTKIKLITTAQTLMMKNGFNATTVDDICAESKLTKGAFFYYFESKEQCGMEVLRNYWQERRTAFQERDDPTPRSTVERLFHFLDTVVDVFLSDEHGTVCLAGSFSAELAQASSAFRSLLAEVFDEWEAQVKPLLSAIAPARTPIDDIAGHIVAVIEGSLLLSTVRQEPGLLRRQVDLLKGHLSFVLNGN